MMSSSTKVNDKEILNKALSDGHLTDKEAIDHRAVPQFSDS